MGNRSWSQKDVEYLCESWGNKSYRVIANHLQRTVTAVIEKAQRLGLGRFFANSDDFITKYELKNALGCSHGNGYINISWIKNRGLKTKTIQRKDKYFEVIYLDEFWEWAYDNRAFLDFSKFEKFSLGYEPEWVDEKRRQDIRRANKYISTPWTPLEDEKLKYYISLKKYGYKDISQKLKRTEGAIQRRICALKINERPVKANNHNKWLKEDYLLLGEMIKQGYKYEYMSDIIGRSAKAIRGRVFDMYLTENLDKVRNYIGEGEWGDNLPVRPLRYLRLMSDDDKSDAKTLLSELAGDILLFAKIKSDVADIYEDYWQKDMCMNWDDIKGCTACESDCDSCTSFRRIIVQYCKRCGRDYFERKENIYCSDCRQSRLKQAQRKFAILNNKGK